MPEQAVFHPEEYEQFKTLKPGEANEQELRAERERLGLSLRESILTVKKFNGAFENKSKLGAFMIKSALRSLEGSFRGLDREWAREVKSIFLRVTGGGEASWSGVIAEFTAARLMEESGNQAFFPGNFPPGLDRPSGYDERTQAEQDRLQGIDWWFQVRTPNPTSYTASVKSMPFTEAGYSENRMVYRLDGDLGQIQQELGEVINDRTVAYSKTSTKSPHERYLNVLASVANIRYAAEQYGVHPLLVLLPSAGSDSDINRETGEPSAHLVEFFKDGLGMVEHQNPDTIDYKGTV